MQMTRMLKPINTKSTILLVCDIQERFRQAIYGFDAMAAGATKMVKAAKLLEIPVIATEQNPRALGTTVQEVGLSSLPDHLNLGVHPKTKFSMFVPPIPEVFQSRSIESAIIVGIESHVCVLQTTLELLRNGTSVYVLADAVSSCNKQEVPIALDLMKQAGATITTTECILFQLVGDASTSIFKPFSNLIKEEKSSTASSLQKLLGEEDPAGSTNRSAL